MKRLNLLKRIAAGIAIALALVIVVLVYSVYFMNNPALTQSSTTALPQFNENCQPLNSSSNAPSLLIGSLSGVINSNQPFWIAYQVNNRDIRNVNNAAVLFSTNSVCNPTSANNYPISSQISSVQIPGMIKVSATLPQAGVYYYRAHFNLDNKDYWSNEMMLTVS
jgi:hypothetical protein